MYQWVGALIWLAFLICIFESVPTSSKSAASARQTRSVGCTVIEGISDMSEGPNEEEEEEEDFSTEDDSGDKVSGSDEGDDCSNDGSENGEVRAA